MNNLLPNFEKLNRLRVFRGATPEVKTIMIDTESRHIKIHDENDF